MHTLLLRRLSLLFTLIFTASLMIFATGVFAQSATPVGETEITGVLESISSGSIVVSGQTINIVNAEIKNMLIVGSTVKVHVSAVGGALAAREVETTAIVDDNSNTNSNANANDNSNANSNANGNSNSNSNANSNANDNTNTNSNANSNDNTNSNSNDNSNTSAAVSAQQAIDIVLQVYPTTDILSIELTSKFGDTLVWEVKIRNGIELNIDAQTAVILTIDRHGNDNNQNNNGNQNGNVNGNDNTDDHGGMGSDDNQNGNSNDNNDDHGGDNGGSGSDNSSNDNNGGMG